MLTIVFDCLFRILQGLHWRIRCCLLDLRSADHNLCHPLLSVELREEDGDEEAGGAEEWKVSGLSASEWLDLLLLQR